MQQEVTTLDEIEKEQKGCRIQIPLFFDMVGDHVVSRSLAILLVFLLFAFTALVLLGGTVPVSYA